MTMRTDAAYAPSDAMAWARRVVAQDDGPGTAPHDREQRAHAG